MKMYCFAKRCAKEIVRDPLNIAFGLGFEVVLLLLLSIIQSNIPVSLFEIDKLAPGIAVFGLSFNTLFSATLISKDRGSAFLSRLFTTPMRAADYILGYCLPIIPMALAQTLFCYAVAIPLGLKVTVNIVVSILMMIPVSVVFIAFGLLGGSIFTEKQVGGICGALFTNVCAWLSGIWFDLNLVGGAFKKIAYMLPFVHAVDMQKAIIAGDFGAIFPHIYWVLGYAILILIIAVLVFTKKMRRT